MTLDFSYTFHSSGQRVSFAYCYPYTFSDLCTYLTHLEKGFFVHLSNPNSIGNHLQVSGSRDNISYQRRLLTRTAMGLPVFILKITASRRSAVFSRRRRKAIFITARQHPGETPGSLVCEGLLEFLLADSPQSRFLLSAFVFFVIPMMNPDGVVLGNERLNVYWRLDEWLILTNLSRKHTMQLFRCRFESPMVESLGDAIT